MLNQTVSKPTSILLVDDERAITENLASLLKRSGFFVTIACDGEAGFQQATTNNPGLVLLDMDLPKLDGREVLRRLRQAGNWAPIIMLAPCSAMDECTLALGEGADAYIHKPCKPMELLAQIEAILRRVRWSQSTSALIFGSLQLELYAQRVTLKGQTLTLTPTEYQLLKYLMQHAGQSFTRQELQEKVMGYKQRFHSRAVDRHICSLRDKLYDNAAKPLYIATLTGSYCFVGQVEPLP